MLTPIITNPWHRDLLEGSLEIAPDTNDLHASIRALLRNMPSVAQVSRVIEHLRTDEFDYESNTASDLSIDLEAYREELYLDARGE